MHVPWPGKPAVCGLRWRLCRRDACWIAPHAVDAALARHVLSVWPPVRGRHLDGRLSCVVAVGPHSAGDQLAALKQFAFKMRPFVAAPPAAGSVWPATGATLFSIKPDPNGAATMRESRCASLTER